jgi:maltooligosyltrehalose trehalohydrolase
MDGATTDAIGRPLFDRCHLDHDFDPAADPTWRMYRELTRLRRADGALAQRAARVAGATLDDHTLVLRYIGDIPHEDRLVVVNLGPDLDFARAPAPIVAPPSLFRWCLSFCSEDPAYGGVGIAGNNPPVKLVATGQATTVFRPGLVP